MKFANIYGNEQLIEEIMSAINNRERSKNHLDELDDYFIMHAPTNRLGNDKYCRIVTLSSNDVDLYDKLQYIINKICNISTVNNVIHVGLGRKDLSEDEVFDLNVKVSKFIEDNNGEFGTEIYVDADSEEEYLKMSVYIPEIEYRIKEKYFYEKEV